MLLSTLSVLLLSEFAVPGYQSPLLCTDGAVNSTRLKAVCSNLTPHLAVTIGHERDGTRSTVLRECEIDVRLCWSSNSAAPSPN